MKNKKGFTIPELLAVIVILGILITISIGVYNGISKRLKENNLNTKIAYFKEKALEYASEENISDETISLNYLLKLGYVSAEYPENPERERIGNPLTGGFLDCMNFTITKDLDNYTATYDLEGSCDLVDQETTMEEISIEKYIKRDNTYIKVTNEWVNEPVYLLVKFLNINKYQVIDDNFNYTIGGNETNKKGIYCSNLTDNDNPLENCYNVNIVDTNYIYNNNIKVRMNLKNNAGDNKAFKISREALIKIDKALPTVTIDYDNRYTTGSIKITLNGNDSNGSGIAGYYFGQTKPENDDIFSSENIYAAHSNGTYYAYTKDNAGNISLEQTITVDNIDRTGPDGFVSSYGRNKWSIDDFTFTFGCKKDNKTGCANEITYTITDITDNRNKVLANNVHLNTPQATYTVTAPSDDYVTTVTLKYTIKDNLGNEEKYGYDTPIKINTYIDRVVPKMKISYSKSADRGFLWRLKGYNFYFNMSIEHIGPSGIGTQGYTKSFNSANDLKNYTNEQLNRYFTTSGSYHVYLTKKKKATVIGRLVSGSGSVYYDSYGITGRGCTNYLGWTVGGAIIGAIFAPGWAIIGGLIGWGICNAS